MLSLLFKCFYAVISLHLEVGIIIIGMVVGGVAGREYKWVDVVGLAKMSIPIIEVAVMAIKEEYMLIELARSTGSTEETHCLHPDIPVHIS